MSSPLAVKICGLTREEDALAACAAGASLLGFVFVPQSPRFVTPERARRIIRALPDGVATVGVFAGGEAAEIDRVAEDCGLAFVQLHGPFPMPGGEMAALLRTPAIRVIRVGGAGDIAAAEALPPGLILLDTRLEGKLGGTGRAFDWSLARGVCARRPVLLAGGLTPASVAGAVRLLRPWGVDVSSGVESAPGVKDHRKVRDFIRAAHAAAREGERRCDPS